MRHLVEEFEESARRLRHIGGKERELQAQIWDDAAMRLRVALHPNGPRTQQTWGRAERRPPDQPPAVLDNGRSRCQARRESDQMRCIPCRRAWDINDEPGGLVCRNA